ncbi:MAG: cytochrome c biogenesis protein ResB [Parachlamydiaceae bacterium]|nr:cytochrome c biogenesis protein ResB [Parachlamydiaceae bacterium]
MINRLYHFLGGITFAMLLIATTACVVIVGTFLESTTDSHRYAAQLTYGSPLFSLLLCGFFINILISALRRHPFKKRHIPFLITHLGMLMVLAGVLTKNFFGVQGTMTILEGSGSQHIFLKDKPSLLVESKNEKEPQFYTFNPNFSRYSLLNPLNGIDVKPFEDELTITLIDYAPNSYETVETWIKGSYTSIYSLRPAPVHIVIYPHDELPSPARIDLPQSKENPWNMLALVSDYDSTEIIAKKTYVNAIKIIIHKMFSGELIYQGALSNLLNDTVSTPFGKLSAQLDFSWSILKGFDKPTLYVDLADGNKDDKIAIALDGDDALLNRNAFPFVGKGKMTVDLTANPTLLMVKDSQNDVHLLAFSKHGQVACSSCTQGNLGAISAYDDGYLGYSLEAKLEGVEGSFNRKMREYVFLSTMRSERDDRDERTKQMSSEILLSCYLRAYGHDSENSLPDLNKFKINQSDIQSLPLVLESPLEVRHRAIPPSKKLEDNVPCVVLRLKKGSKEEIVSLRFDPTGSGFKWPVLNGEFIVRFQPLLQEIPYRLRLRQARQINYATSTQPFSYESDLIVTDRSKNHSVESQISMNNVHETWDGYRFYLSNISPADNGSLKRIQLVVNQDPAKYFLTYPGAGIMILGILLLFFRKNSKSDKRKL